MFWSTKASCLLEQFKDEIQNQFKEHYVSITAEPGPIFTNSQFTVSEDGSHISYKVSIQFDFIRNKEYIYVEKMP